MKPIFSILSFFIFIQVNAQEIKTVSAFKKVMMGEDLSTHIQWDSIDHKNLYAVGPLGRIEGEITILDGKVYSSKVKKNNKIVIDTISKVKSPFAVYAFVAEWNGFELNEKMETLEELQAIIEKIAMANGYDLNKPLAYKLEGSFDKIDFHIISKPKKEKEHNHELHKKAKKHFTVNKTNGTLLGFYSKYHEGIFTHKGQFIHTHFIDDAHKNMGHLDGLIINEKTKIYLSKN